MELKPSRIFVLLVFVLLAFGGATRSSAQRYKDHYRSGQSAITERNWAAGITQLEEAVKLKATPEKRINSKLRRVPEPYIPYYYLGLAFFYQGNCEDATYNWNLSEAHGVVTRLKGYETLKVYRNECAKVLQENREFEKIRSSLNAVISHLQKIKKKQRPLLNSGDWTQSLDSKLQKANLETFEAEEMFMENRSDSSGLKSIEEKLGRTQQLLNLLDSEIETQTVSARSKTLRTFSSLREQARDAVRDAWIPEPWPAGISSLLNAVESHIKKAEEEADGGGELTNTRAAIADLPRLIKRLEAINSEPSPWLVETAENYRRGNYQLALAQLTEGESKDRKEQAYCHLFRAAIHYVLANRSRDEEELKLAKNELDLLLAFDDIAVKPSVSVFPPGFVALFNQSQRRLQPTDTRE